MNCRYVQSHLSAYIDMELTGAEQQRIRAHLEYCMECSAEYETLRRVKHLVRRLPTVMPLSGEEVILQRIREYRSAQRTPRRLLFHTRWWRYAWSIAAIALVMWLTSSDQNSPIRPLQSDALTNHVHSSYPKRYFSFPFFRRSEPSPLMAPHYTPVHSPMILTTSESPHPFAPNPALMPVVENSWSATGTLQPAFGVQP
ncbi:MAG: zf-HC2 domain-containing protein [Fimbriimonadales bacterium]|nr:zf-HC2 domain-containing protein [Fimbriimonadales bacterium]